MSLISPTVEDYHEILAQLRAEAPQMPWESTGGGFRTDHGPDSTWEIQIDYSRFGDWRGSLWNRSTGLALPVKSRYLPLEAMHAALEVLRGWGRDIERIVGDVSPK